MFEPDVVGQRHEECGHEIFFPKSNGLYSRFVGRMEKKKLLGELYRVVIFFKQN